MHDCHLIETDTIEPIAPIITIKPTPEADDLQVSYNGSNTGGTGMVGRGKVCSSAKTSAAAGSQKKVTFAHRL